MEVIKPVLAAEIENQGGVPTIAGVAELFQNVASAVLGLAGIALFIYLLIGGFKYLTSGGDPKAVEEAKKTLTYAIGGIILIAAAYLILKFIETFTGAPVTQFKVIQ